MDNKRVARYSDAELKELYSELFKSKDRGISGLMTLLLRIWNIEKANWPAVKKVLIGLPSGRALVKRLESLPYFDEVSNGDYQKVVKSLDREDKNEMFKQWKLVEERYLLPIEDEWMESLMKNRVASELLKVARELTAGTWALPSNSQEAKTVLVTYKKLKSGDYKGNIANNLYSILGDDQMMDAIEDEKKVYQKACAEIIRSTIKSFAKRDKSTFESGTEYEMIQQIAKKM